MRTLTALLLGCSVALTVRAADNAAIAAFSTAPPGEAPAAWKFATLPNKTATKYSIVDLGGARALKVEAADSYGNLVHSARFQPTDRSAVAWRWRVDKLIDEADLKSRGGEDSAAKLCVFFGFDGSKLPFTERTKLALARSSTGQDVPTQTLCYVWDNKLPIDTSLPSPFTKRIRYIVLQSGSAKLGQWVAQKRDVVADYQRMFGDESEGKTPEVTGVAVQADADNTHGQSLAYFGDITLTP
jgi:hypothetical protein